MSKTKRKPPPDQAPAPPPEADGRAAEHLPDGLRTRVTAKRLAAEALARANAEAARWRKALRAAEKELDRYLSSSFEPLPLFDGAEAAPAADQPPPPDAPPCAFRTGDRVRLAIDDAEPVTLGTVGRIFGLVNGRAAAEVAWDDGENTTEDPGELVRAQLSAEVPLPAPPVRVPANDERLANPAKDWCAWEGGIYGLYAAARTWTDEQLAEALRRFERLQLIAEADGVRGEQNRREKVAAGELEPKPEDAERVADRPWHACPKCGGTGRVCRRCKHGEGRITLKKEYCKCTAPDFDLCKKCGGNGREYESLRAGRRRCRRRSHRRRCGWCLCDGRGRCRDSRPVGDAVRRGSARLLQPHLRVVATARHPRAELRVVGQLRRALALRR
jgi:hypothetical protein